MKTTLATNPLECGSPHFPNGNTFLEDKLKGQGDENKSNEMSVIGDLPMIRGLQTDTSGQECH